MYKVQLAGSTAIKMQKNIRGRILTWSHLSGIMLNFDVPFVKVITKYIHTYIQQ